jgi:hypothetical protein
MIMSEPLADREKRLHPADLDAIRAAVVKGRDDYVPLNDRQKMIIEAAFRTRKIP